MNLQYWADRMRAHESLVHALYSKSLVVMGPHSNIAFMRVMESCLVNSKTLRDAKRSEVAWGYYRN